MKILEVNLAERSYPIFVGTELLGSEGLVEPFVKGTQVLIVTNETVAPLYLESVKLMFADHTLEEIILKDGEKYKTIDTLSLIFNKLLESRFDRYCTLVALGGGVIGDITGFAAASYQRGVNFIQIPTTLLAQVDSSVGGKTGVNHSLGKNMIGAFYQPKCVLADLDTLKTLPEREIYAGLAEVIKYGLINDILFFDWLSANMEKLVSLDVKALAHAVYKSCQNKAGIVAMDERESGVRATLNLGHTFGHAIEASQGYGNWLHGEAVAVGMIIAANLSVRLGWLSEADFCRIKGLIHSANLPVAGPDNMKAADYLRYMTVDKKVRDGQIKLVLLKAIGAAVVTADFSYDKLLMSLDKGDKL